MHIMKIKAMETIRTSLGIILMVYSIPTVLAASDIKSKLEPDLSTEWVIVSIIFILTLVFILANLNDIIKMKRI